MTARQGLWKLTTRCRRFAGGRHWLRAKAAVLGCSGPGSCPEYRGVRKAPYFPRGAVSARRARKRGVTKSRNARTFSGNRPCCR
ncbi:hypothetical protein [Lysobacter gummosus]|uniref:hypothetical protein n=1 Tax=Lysobacter gummosus TaxID=262324 RepID=UPI00363721E7